MKAPVLHTLCPGVGVAWVDLDAPSDGCDAAGSLSPAEREQAARFRFEVHRRRYVAAHAALRSLLAERLGLEPVDVPLHAEAAGKPRLVGDLAVDLRFNMSHSGARALYAVAVGREVGVDVENVRPLPDMEQLALEVFSPAELRQWRSVSAEQRERAFFAGWTRKEAFVKALGQGLGFPLGAFDVSLAPGCTPKILRLSPEGGPLTRWEIHAWSPEPAYEAALVVERCDGQPTAA